MNAKSAAEKMTTLLQCSQVSFAYADHPVLRDVALSLSPGEVVALFGPNGSGKSTLIKALIGHLRAGGRIEWNAKPIESWRRRDLARLIAYLPQSPTFDPGQTVADVLRLGRLPYWSTFGIESPRDLEVVETIARELELTDILDRRADKLSGGQRQRVFVGRCLAQEPAALLLDEPSTFLDLRHQLDLLALLRKLARERGIGILMASHDLNLTATHADRAIVLHEGCVVADGPPAEVLQPDLLERVYGVKMRQIDLDGRVHLIAL